MIAETHYKHQVEADLIPFRDLLLGIFFITVGMQLDFAIIFQYIRWVALLLPLLILAKVLIIFNLLKFSTDQRSALKGALTLFQMGEFALVIFELSFAKGLIDPIIGQILIVVVILSMILTPFVLRNITPLTDRILSHHKEPAEFFLTKEELSKHIVLVGYGRLGRNIAKQLKKEGLLFVAVEQDIQTVKEAQKRDEPVIFGNAGQKNILESVNIKEASAVIIAVDNSQKLHLICKTINDLTHSKVKTIVKVDNFVEEQDLSGLGLSHVIVGIENTALAMVEKVNEV